LHRQHGGILLGRARDYGGLLAYTSGSVGTHLLPLAGEGDQGCLFPWVVGVGADGLG
jgi:hypothetical protein